jgi:hypothetical protein
VTTASPCRAPHPTCPTFCSCFGTSTQTVVSLGLATRLLYAMAVRGLYYHLRLVALLMAVTPLFVLLVAVTTAICFIGGGDDRYLLYWWR